MAIAVVPLTTKPIASTGQFMQGSPIKNVTITGLHASQDLHISLRRGLNIVHGKNGSGKTTLLHVLANLAERDLERFCHIRFQRIIVETEAGATIELQKLNDGDRASIQLVVDNQVIGSVNKGEATPPAMSLVLRERLGGRPVYLPAFRSVLEAANRNPATVYTGVRDEARERVVERILEHELADLAQERKDRTTRRSTGAVRERARAVAQKTILCRDWFGAFVPIVRSPSLIDVSEELQNELHQAQLEIAATDREALTDVFIRAMQAALSENEPEPPEDIQSLLQSVQSYLSSVDKGSTHGFDREIGIVYTRLSSMLKSQGEQIASSEARAKRILKVYENALQNRRKAQERAFAQIKTFEQSVNRFLTGKRLVLDQEPLTRTRYEIAQSQYILTLHDSKKHSFFVLSSGERHVLTLLFSATHMSPADGIVLIDEPELSLHVEWQRIILTELMKQAGERQIVACTHAPEVAGEHRDVLVPLRTKQNTARQDEKNILVVDSDSIGDEV